MKLKYIRKTITTTRTITKDEETVNEDITFNLTGNYSIDLYFCDYYKAWRYICRINGKEFFTDGNPYNFKRIKDGYWKGELDDVKDFCFEICQAHYDEKKPTGD